MLDLFSDLSFSLSWEFQEKKYHIFCLDSKGACISCGQENSQDYIINCTSIFIYPRKRFVLYDFSVTFIFCLQYLGRSMLFKYAKFL